MGIFKALGKQGLIDQNFRYDSLEDVLLEADIKAWRHTHKAMKIDLRKDIFNGICDGVMEVLNIAGQWHERDLKHKYYKYQGYRDRIKSYEEELNSLESKTAEVSQMHALIAQKHALMAQRNASIAEKADAETNEDDEIIASANETIEEIEAAIADIEEQLDQLNEEIASPVDTEDEDYKDLKEEIDDLKEKLPEYEEEDDEYVLKSLPIGGNSDPTNLDELLSRDGGLTAIAALKNAAKAIQFGFDKVWALQSTYHQVHADSDGFVGSVKDMILTLNKAGFKTEIGGWDKDMQKITVVERKGSEENDQIDLVNWTEYKYLRALEQLGYSENNKSILEPGKLILLCATHLNNNRKISLLHKFYDQISEDERGKIAKDKDFEKLMKLYHVDSIKSLKLVSKLNVLSLVCYEGINKTIIANGVDAGELIDTLNGELKKDKKGFGKALEESVLTPKRIQELKDKCPGKKGILGDWKKLLESSEGNVNSLKNKDGESNEIKSNPKNDKIGSSGSNKKVINEEQQIGENEVVRTDDVNLEYKGGKISHKNDTTKDSNKN